MLAMKLSPLLPTTLKSAFLPNADKKKRYEKQFFHSVLFLFGFMGSLCVLLFNVGNLPRRCGHYPYALVAHIVKQGVELPPLGGLVRRFIREEKFVHGYIIPGDKIVKHLQAGVLSFVLNVGKVTRGDIEVAAGLVAALAPLFPGFFYGLPESLEIVKRCRSFHIVCPHYGFFVHLYTFYCSFFCLDMSIQLL